MKPPNILLIMTDQQRRDCVSANSGRWVKTLNVGRLAQEGVNYRRAYATCPICIPSRFTLVALIRKEGVSWYLQGDDLRSIPYDPRYNYYTGQRRPAPGAFKP